MRKVRRVQKILVLSAAYSFPVIQYQSPPSLTLWDFCSCCVITTTHHGAGTPRELLLLLLLPVGIPGTPSPRAPPGAEQGEGGRSQGETHPLKSHLPLWDQPPLGSHQLLQANPCSTGCSGVAAAAAACAGGAAGADFSCFREK